MYFRAKVQYQTIRVDVNPPPPLIYMSLPRVRAAAVTCARRPPQHTLSRSVATPPPLPAFQRPLLLVALSTAARVVSCTKGGAGVGVRVPGTRSGPDYRAIANAEIGRFIPYKNK